MHARRPVNLFFSVSGMLPMSGSKLLGHENCMKVCRTGSNVSRLVVCVSDTRVQENTSSSTPERKDVWSEECGTYAMG